MLVELNEIEKDAIVNHMWPLSEAFPKYKESYILSWVDKYCAVVEVVEQGYKAISRLKMFSKGVISE